MHIRQINSTEHYLVTHLFDQYRQFYGQPSDPELSSRFIKERLQKGESVIFVALETADSVENPVGFTQLYPTYSSVRAVKNWILNDLFVAEEHRRKGIGESLIQAALHFAAVEGCAYVQLETAVTNTGAQQLYEAIGFIKQEPETEYLTYRMSVR
jgi:ribosomal protein S18 acetylase RimI-like enzyme